MTRVQTEERKRLLEKGSDTGEMRSLLVLAQDMMLEEAGASAIRNRKAAST